MLLVTTTNSSEQSMLSEQFSCETNTFAIPFREAPKLKDLVKNIRFQQYTMNQIPKCQQVQKWDELCQKIQTMSIQMLNFKFNLTTLRSIFQIIYSLSDKLDFYAKYWMAIGDLFEGEILDKEIVQQGEQRYWREEIQGMQGMQKMEGREHEGLEEGSGDGKNPILQTSFTHSQFQLCPDPNTASIHSLRSQLPISPKFKLPRVHAFTTDKNQYNQQQDTDRSISNIDIEDLTFLESSKSSLMLSTQGSEQKGFLDSLSGRIPLQSFLHEDDIIGDMIHRETKEDIRKSKILKQAIQKEDSSTSSTTKTRDFSSSLRNIKLQQKLRKNSRNKGKLEDDIKTQLIEAKLLPKDNKEKEKQKEKEKEKGKDKDKDKDNKEGKEKDDREKREEGEKNVVVRELCQKLGKVWTGEGMAKKNSNFAKTKNGK